MAIEDLISVFPVWNISSSLHSNIVCVCVCIAGVFPLLSLGCSCLIEDSPIQTWCMCHKHTPRL